MSGEVIKHVDPHIGLLHRGTEKLLEYKTYLQGIPYFARLDYVSTLSQEHVFCLCLEKLMNIKIEPKISYFRILFLELTRILNHILALTTHALDVGAMTPFLWSFEEREKIMEFYERISGARMHSTFFRPGGLNVDFDDTLITDIRIFSKSFKNRLNEIYNLLYNNKIWRLRLSDIGILNKISLIEYSISGPLLRSSGVNWDLRKILQYESYNHLNFNAIVGTRGDCLDRFIVRLEEMRESIFIIEQCSKLLLKPKVDLRISPDFKLRSHNKESVKKSMEYIINHFKYFTEGFFIEEDDIYVSAETPKGEFGVHIESSNSNKPSRVKIRSTGFLHLQALNDMVRNNLLADLVTIIGTLDLVFGEVDR